MNDDEKTAATKKNAAMEETATLKKTAAKKKAAAKKIQAPSPPVCYVEVVFNIPAARSFTYSSPQALSPGCRVVAPFRGRSLTGFVTASSAQAPAAGFEIKSLSRVIDEQPLFDAVYLDLAKWVASMYFASLGETLSAMIPGARRESEVSGIAVDQEEVAETPLNLSEEQNQAVETIMGSPGGTSYLFGITGSGKTEVFLRAAAGTLAEGRGVIYLVPEIALTGQVAEAIRSRFGKGAAILHSRLTPSQRLGEWRRIMRGEARLVVGARSAVFAPLNNLGLIILDEEHEGSYKSGSSPRYHARQVAMRRCLLCNARLVMGSATPSVEAFHLMRQGGLKEIRLSRRPAGGGVPRVEIVDLAGQDGVFSSRLKEAVLTEWKAGRQSILFLNRRGFSHFFHCNSCGYEMKCKNCSVGLTYHKKRNRMICHYCGYTAKLPGVCPECGSLDVGFFGFGTEKIEEESRRVFPELRIARLDTDAVKAKGNLEQTLADFREGRIDLLLGTQMVAKGLNFRGVSLVGIVLADTGLHLPDFRSLERTFALIVQVAGRAGRFSKGGRVIVQTYAPANTAIRGAAASAGDTNITNIDTNTGTPGASASASTSASAMEDFYRAELEARKALCFPPFSRLFRLVARGKTSTSVISCAAQYARALQEKLKNLPAVILGPCECPLAIISGNHRHQILIRTTAFDRVHAGLRQVLDSQKPPHGVYLEIDVDPVSLL
ncbi:MAG: primosomal protein N' [Spirochaetales bacterium]|jgi:primosomal protein N' (replication factor Y)|nr:primosomal protein N' [Spirochaetales bacterium]